MVPSYLDVLIILGGTRVLQDCGIVMASLGRPSSFFHDASMSTSTFVMSGPYNFPNVHIASLVFCRQMQIMEDAGIIL